MKSKEKLYKEMKGIIISRAVAQHYKTGLDLDDLIAQGNLIFCECYRSFNGSVEFSTFLWACLTTSLFNYCQDNFNTREINLADDVLLNLSGHYTDKSFAQIEERSCWDNLSRPAKFVVNEIFNHRTKIENSNFRIKRHTLRCYLKKRKHWPDSQINCIFRELEGEFS